MPAYFSESNRVFINSPRIFIEEWKYEEGSEITGLEFSRKCFVGYLSLLLEVWK